MAAAATRSRVLAVDLDRDRRGVGVHAERVLPQTGLRQWVLTFPFSWRRRLAQDGALLGRLTRIFEETVQTFYAERAAKDGIRGAKTGSVTVVQRTSSDLRLNPHLHLVALDGACHEQDAELAWHAPGHLKTSEVGEVLERTVRRIEKHLCRVASWSTTTASFRTPRAMPIPRATSPRPRSRGRRHPRGPS
jgi:hypothetical protein